jgi:hypothetical protein
LCQSDRIVPIKGFALALPIDLCSGLDPQARRSTGSRAKVLLDLSLNLGAFPHDIFLALFEVIFEVKLKFADVLAGCGVLSFELVECVCKMVDSGLDDPRWY